MESEVTKYLSDTIGNRRSGTEADKKAAEYLEGKMKEIGLEEMVNKLFEKIRKKETLDSMQGGKKSKPKKEERKNRCSWSQTC